MARRGPIRAGGCCLFRRRGDEGVIGTIPVNFGHGRAVAKFNPDLWGFSIQRLEDLGGTWSTPGTICPTSRRRGVP